MEIETLKSILRELEDIANCAINCPELNFDLKREAEYAKGLTIKAQDIIRVHEIDCLLDKRKELIKT